MSIRDDHSEDEDLQAPASLVSALRKLPSEDIFVPPTVDEAVLRAARRRLGQSEGPRFRWFGLRVCAAAAAVILLLALLGYYFLKPVSKDQRQPAFAREDLNHDGRIDILDAFILARKLKMEASPDSRFDVNGDGIVDERDTATIATRAVRLQQRGRS